MLGKTRKSVILFIAIYSLLHSYSVNAVELGSFGNSVFQFQKRMASKGNTSAEYKLGTLYEFGISVPSNIEEASKYYKRAAKKKYAPAINRLTYLEIKQSGYNKSKHDSWFKSLNDQATSSDPNALILLGQMYQQGINVNKNLNKSLAMLQKAAALGHTEVDSQIDEIYRELEAKAELQEKVEQQKQAEKAAPKPAKKAVKKPLIKTAAKKSKSTLAKEAKRRKYEEAMRKLYQESLIMQQQQEWSESEE